MKLKGWEKLIPYCFIFPFIFSFILFFVIPAIYSFALSFARFPGYGEIKWIGLHNYKNIMIYSRFWESLGRTFFYWVAKFIPVTVISFMLAVCLQSRLLTGLSKFYKPILFLPQICATTASALVFMVIFAKQTGVINQLLGLDISWIESSIYSRYAVLILLLWRATGWYMVVYVSGLTSISPDVLEAGIIDGANAIQRLLKITIPLMKQTFIFAFTMDAINSLRMYTEAAVLTANDAGGIARQDAEGVINLLVMNLGSGNFGMASAYGWILFIIIFVIALLILNMFKDKKIRYEK